MIETNVDERRILILNDDLMFVDSGKADVDELITKIAPDKKYTVKHHTINSQFFQKNYMEYLEHCYDKHMGYVLSPELIWYSLLTEIAGCIKDNSEKYRDKFTDSDEKKEIVVTCPWSQIDKLPGLLTDELKNHIPNAGNYLPSFSTETPQSKFAFSTAFCDAVSPYYNFGMLCCGFPSVEVKGTEEDWRKVYNHFKWVSRELNLTSKIKTIIESLDDLDSYKSFYNDIFKLKRCGSGGQVEASGWFIELFMKIPCVLYTYNFSSQVSRLNFKNLTENKNYMISSGIMKTNYDNDNRIATPDFGYVLYLLENE